jgi:hypothetical protein
MITGRNVRALIKDSGGDLGRYRQRLRELLGVKVKDNANGRFPFQLRESEASISHDEFSVRELAYEFLGRDYVEGLGNEKGGEEIPLREAVNPVLSSNFQNINAFNQTIGGLIEQRVLAGFLLPEYIAEQIFETMPTKVNGGKLIGIPNVQLSPGFTPEGQEHSEMGLTERWVIAPSNKKKTKKLALTKEAVAYDLTGELMSQGESMGKTLGYEKEYWCAGVAQGVDFIAGTPGFVEGLTNNTFIYKGQPTDTPNATYQTAAGTGTSAKYNFVNSLTNSLTDYKSFQVVQNKLNLMREYETGYPILTRLSDVLVSPNSVYNAKVVIHSSQVLNTTGTSGLSGSAGVGTFAGNPIPNVNLISSQIWNKVLVDSGVSQTNADIRWWAGEFKKAFVWREVWPMAVLQANPTSTDLIDKQIVNAWFASWYGTPMVRDPHYVVESTE